MENIKQLKEKAFLFYKSNNYKDAISCYNKAICIFKFYCGFNLRIDLTPDNPSLYYNRCKVLIKMKNYKEALEDSLLSIKLDSQYIKAYLITAQCHLYLGDIENAEIYLLNVSKKDPKNQKVLEQIKIKDILKANLNKAELFISSGRISDAFLIYNSILKDSPKDISAKRGIARCNLEKKNISDAMQIIDQILLNDPYDEKTLILKAEALYYKAEVLKALNLFSERLEADPDSVHIQMFFKKTKETFKNINLGYDLLSQKKYLPAIEVFEKVLINNFQNDFFNSKIYYNRALCYLALDKFEEALTDCNQTIILNQNYVEAYICRAKCYSMASTKFYNDSINEWKKAKELDPSNEGTLF